MPVLDGLPPVASAVSPGKESDGIGVCAPVNWTPSAVRPARAEPGWLATYQARSV
jgi:hypothetical protein